MTSADFPFRVQRVPWNISSAEAMVGNNPLHPQRSCPGLRSIRVITQSLLSFRLIIVPSLKKIRVRLHRQMAYDSDASLHASSAVKFSSLTQLLNRTKSWKRCPPLLGRCLSELLFVRGPQVNHHAGKSGQDLVGQLCPPSLDDAKFSDYFLLQPLLLHPRWAVEVQKLVRPPHTREVQPGSYQTSGVSCFQHENWFAPQHHFVRCRSHTNQ